ncbi:MAG: putative drug exporter of the superfamily, partial [Solirubrobacteraceae bacterium]|nr:putative drug exporter of the superfamily [Solirubrobacteraceae bacterium]
RIADRPRHVLAAAVVFLAAAIVFGTPVTGLLSAGNADDFVDPNAESTLTSAQLERALGRTLSPAVIVLVRTGGPVMSSAGRAKVQSVVTRVRADRAVAQVTSVLGDGGRADAAAGSGAAQTGTGGRAGAPRSPLVSRDGRATYVATFLRAGADQGAAGERITAELAGIADVVVGGYAVAVPQVSDQVSEDLAKAETLAFPLLFVLSLLIFRGAVASLLPLFVGLLTIMGTFLGLRIVNEGVLLSIFALNLTIGLGLGLAIDYSLFVLSRYREEMERLGAGREALVRTLQTAGRTVIFSSLTVAAAMLSLLVFQARFLYSMGIAGAITAVVAGTVALTALPALLIVLGERVNALAPARLRHREVVTERGFFFRLSLLVMRRPVAIALLTAAVLVAAGLPFLRIQFTGVDASVLPAGSTAKIVDTALRREFPPGPSSPLHVAVTAPRSAAPAMRDYAGRLARLEGAASVAAPSYAGTDTWRVEVTPASPPLDEPALDLVDRVRAGSAPGPVAVAGESARFIDQVSSFGGRLPLALALLALTTIVILFAMTASVVLPLKALVMNVLGLSAAFGLLVLVFQDGRLESLLDFESQGALEVNQPIVLLAIAFGLSTDYGVLLLTRIKEARDAGAPNEQAIAIGMQRTGRIVTAAAALLCVAIGSFATSSVIFVKEVGLGTAAAVLIDATIVRALLVPSLMKLLGERNWWAPAPLRRLHERLRLGERG